MRESFGIGESCPSSITTMCRTESNDATTGHTACKDRPVDEQHVVGCVVHDVADLLAEQPVVDGVQDAAAARYGEVELDVTLVVERERADAGVRRYAESVQRVSQLSDARRHVRPGRDRLGGPASDDTLVSEVSFDTRVNKEGIVSRRSCINPRMMLLREP